MYIPKNEYSKARVTREVLATIQEPHDHNKILAACLARISHLSPSLSPTESQRLSSFCMQDVHDGLYVLRHNKHKNGQEVKNKNKPSVVQHNFLRAAPPAVSFTKDELRLAREFLRGNGDSLVKATAALQVIAELTLSNSKK